MRGKALSYFGASTRMKSSVVAFLFIAANIMTTLGVFVPSASADTVWEFITDGSFLHPGETFKPLEENGYIPVIVPSLELNGTNNLSKRFSSLKVSFKYQNVGMGQDQLKYTWRPYGVHDSTTTLNTLVVPDDDVVRTEEKVFSVGDVDQIAIYLQHGTANQPDSPSPTKYFAISDFALYGEPIGSEETPTQPAAPVLTSPADGADVYTHYPQLMWQRMSNVDEYTIELSESDEFADIVWSATHVPSVSIDDHFHTITSFPFEDDVTYYWRVKASNELGESDWSTVRSFTVRAEPDTDTGTDADTPGQGQTGNEGESVKTAATTTNEAVTAAQFTSDQTYYAVAGARDVAENTADTSSDEIAASDDEAEDTKEENAPFLLLGWWWIPLLIAAGGGVYYFFRTPSED